MEPRIRIGDMLVAAGLIDQAQLERALASQKQSGRRLGEELVALGLLTEIQVTQTLSNQLAVPWVSLYHVEFSRELLNRISAETAERYCLIPIYVRSLHREGDTLFIAMDDPTNEDAIAWVRSEAGLPVKPMVAPPAEIRNAIRVYYFAGKGRGASAPAPPPGPPAAYREPAAVPPPVGGAAPVPPPPKVPPSQPKPPAPEAAAKAAAPAPVPEAPAPESPAPKKRAPRPKAAAKGPRMITLTLLDGTSVRLPAPGSKGDEPEDEGAEQGLTATDLVAALLARAQGADVSDVLPDDRWETIFATLLALLVRKGLIADWEFVEEWKKRQG